MITIRRVIGVTVIGGLVGASIALSLPQHVSAQANVAHDAADDIGSSGTMPGSDTAASSPAAPVTGSHLHVQSMSETAPFAQHGSAAPGAVSEGEPAIHADMARTARSGSKPAAPVPPEATAFKLPASKPASGGAGSGDTGSGDTGSGDTGENPSPEQVTEIFPPPEESLSPEELPAPVPFATEPSRSEEAVVARPPEPPAVEGTETETMETEATAADQQAALPPAPDSIRPSAIATLVFAPDSATLSSDAERVLKDFAARFSTNDGSVRLQLMAYAGGEGMSASKARRLSLARALSVRAYLIANGLDGGRMDVRALGDREADAPGSLPGNRVDIAMIRR